MGLGFRVWGLLPVALLEVIFLGSFRPGSFAVALGFRLGLRYRETHWGYSFFYFIGVGVIGLREGVQRG